MADIKYTSETNFKRGLKGIVDWIKAKYVQGSIITDGGGYPRSVKFDITPASSTENGYIKFGENDDNNIFIESWSGGPGQIYSYTLAKGDELTKWNYAAATQTAPKNFTLSGPAYNSIIPTVAFIEGASANEFRIRCNYGTGDNAITIDKNIPTKEYVDSVGVRTVSFHDNKGQSNQALTGVGMYMLQNDYVGYNIASTTNGYQITIVDEASGGDVQSISKNIPDETRVNALITEGLGSISGVNFQVVQTLPATGVNGVFYLIANPTATGSNIYDEYVWVNKGTTESPNYAFERLGTMDVDLTDYTKTSDFVALTNDEVDAILVEIGVKTATPAP